MQATHRFMHRRTDNAGPGLLQSRRRYHAIHHIHVPSNPVPRKICCWYSLQTYSNAVRQLPCHLLPEDRDHFLGIIFFSNSGICDSNASNSTAKLTWRLRRRWLGLQRSWSSIHRDPRKLSLDRSLLGECGPQAHNHWHPSGTFDDRKWSKQVRDHLVHGKWNRRRGVAASALGASARCHGDGRGDWLRRSGGRRSDPVCRQGEGCMQRGVNVGRTCTPLDEHDGNTCPGHVSHTEEHCVLGGHMHLINLALCHSKSGKAKERCGRCLQPRSSKYHMRKSNL